MLRLLIPVLFLFIGVGGGVGAALFLTEERGNTDVAASDDHADDDDHSEDNEYSSADSPYEYVRLNNQFIVPIVRHGTVRSLVVMSLTVEVDAGENEAVFDREPRLRDAFLRVMFAHANVGGFDDSFTSVEAMTPLRSGLREAAHQVLGDIAHDVLIVDIVRQDA